MLITLDKNIVGGGHHVLRLFLKYFLKKGYKVTFANLSSFQSSFKRMIDLAQRVKPHIIVRISGPYIPKEITKYVNNCIVINYVHFPYEGTLKGLESPPTLEGKLIDIVRILSFRIEKCEDSLTNTLILTNSHYTKVILKKVLKVNDVIVIHPTLLENEVMPIDYYDFIRKFSHCRIISLGTYTLGKRYHYIPILACSLKNCLFFVAGYAGQRYQKMYLNLLRRIGKFLYRNNIVFLSNVNENLKKEILMRSSMLLHLRFFEHFGIAILEAIRYGTIPIVHYSGGMIELCKYTQFCEFFHSYQLPSLVNEMKQLIERIKCNDVDKMYSRYLRALRIVNKVFTFKNFEKAMDEILAKYTKI